MTRELDPAVQQSLDDNLTGSALNTAVLFFGDFDDDPLFVWTGVGDLDHNGRTYKGVGEMGAMSSVIEDAKLSDVRYNVTLSAIPAENLPDIVSAVTDGNPNGRDFELDLAFFDADTNLVGVLPLTAGFMDGATINEIANDNGELLGSIGLGLSSEASRLSLRKFVRETNQAQQEIFPGDKGFEFVGDTSMKEILWGQRASVVDSGSTTGGFDGACIADDMWLKEDLKAGDCIADDMLDVLNEIGGVAIGNEYSQLPMEGVSHSVQPCFEIETSGGAKLICSNTTPVTLKSGEMVFVDECLGGELATIIDGHFEWQTVIRVDHVSPRMVAHIYIHDKTFAAGVIHNARIFTHNMAKPRGDDGLF